MTEDTKNTRPAVPAGGTFEDDLRKTLETSLGRSRAQSAPGPLDAAVDHAEAIARKEAHAGAGVFQRRATGVNPAVSVGYGGVAGVTAMQPLSPLPTGRFIADRLERLGDRLRMVSMNAGVIAITLAGPRGPEGAGAPMSDLPPAASLFVVYERALDEIDRIVDNIESEQARTRNILGD